MIYHFQDLFVSILHLNVFCDVLFPVVPEAVQTTGFRFLWGIPPVLSLQLYFGLIFRDFMGSIAFEVTVVYNAQVVLLLF
jgi:hypothetical protein